MLKLEENNLISRSKSLLSLYHDAKRCENMSKSDGKRLQYSFLPIRNFRGIAWRLDYEQKELQARGFWMEGFGKEEMIQTMFAIWSERFERCHNTLMPSNTWHDVIAQSSWGSRGQSWWVSRLLCFALELRAHVPRSVFQTFQEIHNVEAKKKNIEKPIKTFWMKRITDLDCGQHGAGLWAKFRGYQNPFRQWDCRYCQAFLRARSSCTTYINFSPESSPQYVSVHLRFQRLFFGHQNHRIAQRFGMFFCEGSSEAPVLMFFCFLNEGWKDGNGKSAFLSGDNFEVLDFTERIRKEPSRKAVQHFIPRYLTGWTRSWEDSFLKPSLAPI